MKIPIFSALFLMTACTSLKVRKASEAEPSDREKATALLTSLETGNPAPVGYIHPERYTQHNLAVKDGLSGFGELMAQLPRGSVKARVIRAFSDGDYVFTHTRYDFFGPKAGFDIFRFEKGKIVAHWDNLAPVAESPNPGGHTQFDGPVRVEDLSKTPANKALVRDFIETVLIRGEFDRMGGYFDGDRYIQHNPAIGDGVSGLVQAIQAMAEQGVTMVYHKLHLILGEGNFVLAVSQGEFAGNPTAFYDLFRIQDGKIAEHWDVMETIPPESQWQNPNGKFGFK